MVLLVLSALGGWGSNFFSAHRVLQALLNSKQPQMSPDNAINAIKTNNTVNTNKTKQYPFPERCLCARPPG